MTVAAASLGYHAFNTLIPLALFSIIALSLLDQFELAAAVVRGTPLVVFGALTASFLPPYCVLPGERVAVREALPGAVFAAASWTVLGLAIRIHARCPRPSSFTASSAASSRC